MIHAARFTLCTAIIALLVLLLAACGDPAPTAPPATAEPPAPIAEDTALPSPTAVTLGEAPVTPTATTPPSTATPSEASLTQQYTSQAITILSGVIGSADIADAVQAAGDAGANALFGNNVDVNGLGDKLSKAAQVVTDAGEQFAALHPPAAYKDTHERAVAAFQKYDSAFSDAQTAITSGNWIKVAGDVNDIIAATNELSTLLQQLSSAAP